MKIDNLLLTLIGANSLGIPLANAQSVSQKQRPNVVFVYADDMGRGMLSHYGQQIITTPNIDRLFAQGTSFENAYGCMFSAPARASMLTGYNDCRHDKWFIEKGGLFRTSDIKNVIDSVEAKINSREVKLAPEDLLLPQVFKKAGYVTGEIGKLDWGFTVTRQEIKAHGWDYYYGYLDHVRCHGYYPPFLFENGEIVPIEGNTHVDCAKAYETETPENYKKRWDMTGKAVYSQHLFIEKAVQFIRDNKNHPFFLYHPTQLPHGPVAIPAVDPEIKNNPNLSEIEKEYASMVKMLDDNVGVLVAELDSLGILENTIFIFSADNGHETYYTTGNRCRKAPERDTAGKRFDAWNYPYTSERAGDVFNGNDGFTGKKWSNLEGGVRVPLVFSWPNKIRTANQSNQLVSNYDLITTFADLLGVDLPVKKDGVSIVPILLDKQDKLTDMRYVYVNSPIGPAVIDSEGWKMLYNKKLKIARLFYLPQDERELVNEMGKHPEVEKRLMNQVKKILNYSKEKK